ncbi:BPTI/Kunitz domain-containing protein 4-like isoform X2 [Gigantopelta aegis]|uniref:BPTI/Kunitz domain-containing protein 4-like isoform X2 n=1 Tax=Gigantopelta aegis TaxID=1735272 RepID=UPI001B888C3F|nr:BPTI/Kunitz domain-containing protein 4-like isoform X2 [Gigantopelta aegis]XP_041352667.1 BPTI/Kunitz domain-containing protein 4-like isoform X2 [Gigantopelta aegis]
MKTAVLLLSTLLGLLATISSAQGKKIGAAIGMRPPRIQCMMYCPHGFDLTKSCKCLPPPISPCAAMLCGPGMKCVPRGNRGVCVPRINVGGKVCLQPKVVGRCRAAFRRFFYNKITGRCQRFIYGGCQGNQNNFKTLAACQKLCVRGKPILGPWWPWRRHVFDNDD